MSRVPRRSILLVGLTALALALPVSVSANHSWGGYHWARTSNPFTLRLGDNVNATWDPILATTSGDWSQSTVLDTTIVNGSVGNPKSCKATSGMVQVCNASYGNNGWLGVAGISITGGTHITAAYVKVNDYYFNTATYNSTAWRNLVMCQEVGHTLGLDHQDTNFNNANLGTCMDYTSSPGTNQHPNQGDYDELLCIYDPASAGKTLTTSTHSCTGTGHLDSTTTIKSAATGPGPVGAANGHAADAAWGRLVAVTNGGHGATYVRDLGAGNLVVTYVIWAR